MKTIKNFIYLDEFKMYSLSSQIFEGITEYLINYKQDSKEEQETQKGPVASGRILADIIQKSAETQEKKFLHDYSYHLFEQHLFEQNRVFEVTKDNIVDFSNNISDFTFFKIKSRAVFNDISAIKEVLNNFNKLGEAFTYISNHENIKEAQKIISNTKDRNQKAIFQQKLKSLTDITKLAKEQGLYHEPKFLENLALLLTYGFQDQFEIQLPIDHLIFSANLKRDSLRENEHLLNRKYSRMTEREFVMFGMVTQSGDIAHNEQSKDKKEATKIKELLLNLVTRLTDMELAFTGRLDNEIIIDPIAVYAEV